MAHTRFNKLQVNLKASFFKAYILLIIPIRISDLFRYHSRDNDFPLLFYYIRQHSHFAHSHCAANGCSLSPDTLASRHTATTHSLRRFCRGVKTPRGSLSSLLPARCLSRKKCIKKVLINWYMQDLYAWRHAVNFVHKAAFI